MPRSEARGARRDHRCQCVRAPPSPPRPDADTPRTPQSRLLTVRIRFLLYIYVPPDPQFLLLVLVQILNVKLIVVEKTYCCSVVGVNSNNSNFS